MPTKPERWDYLNHLGAEYHGLVQQGYGITPENRCQRQIDIASEIITAVIPYLNIIAIDLLKGKRKINTANGPTYFSLRGARTTIEDLVHEGVLGVLESIKKYDSKRGSISTFINFYATISMYSAYGSQPGLVKLGINFVPEFRRIIAQSNTRAEAIKALMNQKACSYHRACLVYFGLTGKYVEIYGKIKNENNSPSEGTFENTHLPDESETAKTDHHLEEQQVHDKIEALLKTLTSREEKVLRMKFGVGLERDFTPNEIAKDFSATWGRVRQIESKALWKSRHPSRTKSLIELI